MTMLGYPDVDPEVFTLYEYPGGNTAGESFQSAVDFIQKHPELYPSPPTISIGAFDFVAASEAGKLGYPLVIAGSVVCNTVRFDPLGHCEHASILEAHIGPNSWRIWNAWGGDRQPYDDNGLTALDSLAIIQRSVYSPQEAPDMTPQQAQQLNDLWSLLVQDGDVAAGTGGVGAIKIRLEQLSAAVAAAQPAAAVDPALKASLDAVTARLAAVFKP